MKKILQISTLLSTMLFAEFNFGECAGSKSFEQAIEAYKNDYEKTVTVGSIPKGIQGLKVTLISDKDVDIRLYGSNDDKIVHWPSGILNKSMPDTQPYQNVNISYSGFNGINGKRGHEFIEVKGTTPTAMTMKAFGFKSGYAIVNYSWTGKEDCVQGNHGEGVFKQEIVKDTTVHVGEIPANIKNLRVDLKSDKDIDMQLFSANGTPLVSYNPQGLLSGSGLQSIDYHGMHITWSGYNGSNGHAGHEYITITGNITEALTMKVYGYESGFAEVRYTWEMGTTIKTELKKAPAGLVMRGKTKHSFCDLARGEVDGGYCQIAWADLQPSKETYNYDLLEEAIAEARAFNAKHNKSDEEGFKVLIRIRTGVYSPQWVKDEVGAITWYFKNEDDVNDLPIFWETPFQALYKEMMQTLADKYDNNEVIGAVAAGMCMTKHTEIMWNRTGRKEVRPMNMENLRAARDAAGKAVPYSNTKDYKCLQNQVKIHRDTWKRTSTIFGSHLYQVYDYNDGGKSTDYAKTLDIFEYCTSTLGQRCILGNNSLLHTENNYDQNINKAISGFAKKGFETYYQTHVFKDSSSKRSFNFTNLVSALNLAASWKAVMVELPMGWDCAVGEEIDTSDKTTCTQADYKSTFLQSGRAKLKANVK